MNWEDYKTEFTFDGSFREIYILETSIADWQRLINFLKFGAYKIAYTGTVDRIMPQNIQEIFESRKVGYANLEVYVGSVTLGCHFFDEDEITFDIDPREIKSAAEAENIFDFMHQIGELLNKEVIFTEECSSGEDAAKEVIFLYSPGSKQIQYVGKRH